MKLKFKKGDLIKHVSEEIYCLILGIADVDHYNYRCFLTDVGMRGLGGVRVSFQSGVASIHFFENNYEKYQGKRNI